MRALTVVALLAGEALPLPALEQPQSLAEVAAQERERRKGKAPSRVITDADLRSYAPHANFPPPAPEAPAAEPVAGEDPDEAGLGLDEEDAREEGATVWRGALQQARDDVERLSAEAERIQSLLNGTSSFYGPGRAKVVSRLDQAKQELAAAERRVEQLEDEGRWKGYR